MKERFYFWTGDEVVVTEQELKHIGQLGVDTVYSTGDPDSRYGIFDSKRLWRGVPLEEFPKEFRVHLLLLGVA